MTSCPLVTVHRRLDEAHRLWHQMSETYGDPEVFRMNLNNTIQTLRNVTFHLQKQKSEIPNFDEWYAGWQERMKQDEIMKWLHKARTAVVHEGDLVTNSKCRVSIIEGYDEPPYMEFETSPLKTAHAITDESKSRKLPKHIIANGIFQIERRWFVDSLDQKDLLDVIAGAYGFLAMLVNDCHKIMGLPDTVLMQCDYKGKSHPLDIPRGHLEGKLPCMVVTKQMRTIFIRILTGEMIRFDPVCDERQL